MNILKSLAFVGAVAGVGLSSPAMALNLNFAADFGDPHFSYGQAFQGGAVTSFTAQSCADVNVFGPCYRGQPAFQLAAKRSSTSVLLHPGSEDGMNAMVLFTAPYSAYYTFSATLTRGDSGDGVAVYTLGGSQLTFIGNVDSVTPTLTYAGTQYFIGGTTYGIGVERGGANQNYFGDSTFLSGSVAAVPEPAAWALMIVGFGAVGGAMRRRSLRAKVAFA